MKVAVLVLAGLLLSLEAQANFACSSVFVEAEQKLETETQNEKPRYYNVRGFKEFRGGELDRYLQEVHNLTQLSERLSEISTFIPDRTTIPSEAFYVANRIVPLIEDYLKAHDIKFRIETYERQDVKRTLLVIEEEGTTNLNQLSAELWKHGKVSLVVDPMELFYGYEHYNQSQGKFFDIDSFNEGYAMSFHLLLHSQRKDFKMSEIERTDRELQKSLVEMKIEEIATAPKEEVIKEVEARDEERFAETRAKSAAHMNELIKKAQEKNKNKPQK